MSRIAIPLFRLVSLSAAILAAVALAGAGSISYGQKQETEQPPQPPDPLFRPVVPEHSLCKVTISRPALERLAKEGNLPKGLPPLETEREIVPGKKLTLVRKKFSNGEKSSAYYLEKLVLVENVKGNAELHHPGSETWPDHFRKQSFPELEWVQPGHYKGIEMRGGQAFHAYEGSDFHSRSQKLYVDARTMMPVLLESEGGRYAYSYRSGDGGEIAIPEKLDAAWRIYRKNMGVGE